MSPIYEPVATKTQGNDKIVFMTGVANLAAPSLASEVNAATSVEGTLAMYGSWDAPVNVNTGQAPPRIGTTSQAPQEGNAQRQVIPVTYPVDPSKDKTDPNNKMWALLAEGTVVDVFVRRGVDKDTDFAVGDRGWIYRCRAGYRPEPGRTSDDEFGEYRIAQNLIPLGTGEPVEAVLAA